ncbi:MAG: anti-sigma factor [Dehalococcoidia bacterium]
MDCDQIAELLDAYSLGVAEPDEAAAIEEHVADCVRCWSSLSEAQQAAASLALSSALQRAPELLRRRILSEIDRADEPVRDRVGAGRVLARLWPVGAGALAATAAASLVFAVVLQSEVNDLQDENDSLASEVQQADSLISDQRQIMTVFGAPDMQQVTMQTGEAGAPITASYHWSADYKVGAILCDQLPDLQKGEVYKVWLLSGDEPQEIDSFYSWDGIGPFSLEHVERPAAGPVSVGLSIDDADAPRPGRMLLWADLSD